MVSDKKNVAAERKKGTKQKKCMHWQEAGINWLKLQATNKHYDV